MRRLQRQGTTTLYEWRCIKNTSQMTLQEVTGLSQATISQIENRRVNPTMEELEKLALALDFPFAPKTLIMKWDEWLLMFDKEGKFNKRQVIDING